MLNCISGMVEKTQRAISILQQRQAEVTNVRSAEELVADIQTKASLAIMEVKQAALNEISQVKQRNESLVHTKSKEEVKLFGTPFSNSKAVYWWKKLSINIWYEINYNFDRRVGTAEDWPRRLAAGVAWLDIVDHFVNTRTGMITPESADKCRRHPGHLRLRSMSRMVLVMMATVLHRERYILLLL